MTREEAIELLKHCESEHYCSQFTGKLNCDRCNKRIALDMAISALKGEKDGRIRYKLSKPIEYIELVYTDKEVTQLSYDPNITLVTPKADRPTDDDDIKDRQIKQLAHEVVILEKQLADRPSGKWQQVEVIDDDEPSGINTDASECSVCGAIQQSHYWATHYYNYCPNCGARMDGDNND